MSETDVKSAGRARKVIKSVKLINEEESKLISYQAYLDSLAQGTSISSEIFTNKGKAHASILMATLLANTEHEVKMYCQGLSPGILCGKTEKDGEGFEGSYWNEFKRFFGETLKSNSFGQESVKILIQKQDWLRNQPFQVISHALQDQETCNKILIRQISPESKSEIVRVLGDNGQNDYNFATFDNKAYRLEYNPNDYQASGSFNNPSWCDVLNRLFDSIFKSAKDITKDIRQLNMDKELSLIVLNNESSDNISQESFKDIVSSSINGDSKETIEEIIKSVKEHLKNKGIIEPDVRLFNEAFFKEESSKVKDNVLLKKLRFKNPPSKKYKYNSGNYNDNDNYYTLNIYVFNNPADLAYFNLSNTTDCIEEISTNENLPCLLT